MAPAFSPTPFSFLSPTFHLSPLSVAPILCPLSINYPLFPPTLIIIFSLPQNLPHLESLDLSITEVSDLSSLSHLRHSLKSLSLYKLSLCPERDPFENILFALEHLQVGRGKLGSIFIPTNLESIN